ncbi:ribosome biogenesis GTP-binding protein YsxC [Candidatus Cytomitobacter indipagum]|uniref:Probable GTP-binding protein EngB n=1 Tax=Candidatus Cytomitobacter indipagum TaxID=2601575 RepID=A0A5C0UD16_9PROT|nr:ribosome biogenesis GTP-binding protein YihA/YsxC [Candidatus Cytomitobacter indipagum]QEK37915.1 ribosome biogenesis GTP-binding protein YsxC [Candidatus Cytomitobacter indipagum]
MIKVVNKTYFISELPENNKYEIAFIGRSNVGKSSLLNAILNHKISRVSKTPGCTRWLGYYQFKDISLIDLPGYGYAEMSKKRIGLIDTMIEKYLLSGRVNELWVLIDSRRGIMEIDLEIINFARENNVELKIISTKNDKKDVKIMEAYFYTSAKTKHGIDKITAYMNEINSNHSNHR